MLNWSVWTCTTYLPFTPFLAEAGLNDLGSYIDWDDELKKYYDYLIISQ